MTEYKPGTPCWVDLGTSDLEGAKEFYTGLFGWTAEVADAPEAGGYTMFLLNGEQVAGAMAATTPEQPTAWNTYVAVTDTDGTLAKAQEAGGRTLMPPMDVMDAGRMAMFADSAGAVLGLWQPGTMKGAGLVNEPGTLTWDELNTWDPAAAKKFYAETFGWSAKSSPMDGMEYTEFQVDGRTVAGLMAMDKEHFPEETPANWAVYFGVSDCDAALDTVGMLGGTVVVPTTQIPIGKFAVCQDPQGAYFSLYESTGEASEAGEAAAG